MHSVVHHMSGKLPFIFIPLFQNTVDCRVGYVWALPIAPLFFHASHHYASHHYASHHYASHPYASPIVPRLSFPITDGENLAQGGVVFPGGPSRRDVAGPLLGGAGARGGGGRPGEWGGKGGEAGGWGMSKGQKHYMRIEVINK